MKRVKLTISTLQGWGLAKGLEEMEYASGDGRQEAEVEEQEAVNVHSALSTECMACDMQ
jgi:hypothetical protein